MPRYRVDLVQHVTEGATLIVEADDEDAAERIALEREQQEGVEWDFLKPCDEPTTVVQVIPLDKA